MSTTSSFPALSTFIASGNSGFVHEFPFFSSFRPVGYQGIVPWSQQPLFDKAGYNIDSAFKAEEARLEGWKQYQEQERKRLDDEVQLRNDILARAAYETTFWKESLALLDLQKQSAEAKVEKEKEKLDLEIQLLKAQTELAKAQAAGANIAPAAPSNEPPTQDEADSLIASLDKLDPCESGNPWVHNPDTGRFECTGGSHVKSYAEARQLIAQKMSA
ncbi:hypothetical protein DL96DRAFT_1822148 [Flagelloscypha sp. PMI_526]|nr:hypothetical protein DL96DRAFT_1822148 [Flagelloscypha sp. PMI_526]